MCLTNIRSLNDACILVIEVGSAVTVKGLTIKTQVKYNGRTGVIHEVNNRGMGIHLVFLVSPERLFLRLREENLMVIPII